MGWPLKWSVLLMAILGNVYARKHRKIHGYASPLRDTPMPLPPVVVCPTSQNPILDISHAADKIPHGDICRDKVDTHQTVPSWSTWSCPIGCTATSPVTKAPYCVMPAGSIMPTGTLPCRINGNKRQKKKTVQQSLTSHIKHVGNLFIKQINYKGGTNRVTAEFKLLEREVCVLKLLKQFEWCPRLVESTKVAIATQSVGTTITSKNVPFDAVVQFTQILNDMASVGVKHNDIISSRREEGGSHKIELMVMDGRLSLIDFGWATVNDAVPCNVSQYTFVKDWRPSPDNAVLKVLKQFIEQRKALNGDNMLRKSSLVPGAPSSSSFPPPSPDSHICANPGSTPSCNACAACCHSYISVGAPCDECVNENCPPSPSPPQPPPPHLLRDWAQMMQVNLLAGEEGAELHLMIFWNPQRSETNAMYSQALQRFNGSIVGQVVHPAFGNKEVSARKITEFYQANLRGKLHLLNGDSRGKHPFIILFLRLPKSMWIACKGGISARGQQRCPPTNTFKNKMRKEAGSAGSVDSSTLIHATDNKGEVESNLLTLRIEVVSAHQSEAFLQRQGTGKSAIAVCTRDPACPIDPVCFPRSLAQVMAAATMPADPEWGSVVELLHGLTTAGVAYVISRNWEQGIPPPGAHPDIDLLVSDHKLADRVIGGVPGHPADAWRIQLRKRIAGVTVDFDPRYIGDRYIDPAWATDVVRRRQPRGPGGTFIMEPVDAFFFLLYHAVIQKPKIAPDYNNRLEQMAEALLIEKQQQEMPPTLLLQAGSKKGAKKSARMKLLEWYMSAHHYAFTKPSDHSVYFNVPKDMAGESKRPCGVSLLT